MLKLPGRFSVLLFALYASLWTNVDQTSAAPLTKIRVGYPSPSASMYPLSTEESSGRDAFVPHIVSGGEDGSKNSL